MKYGKKKSQIVNILTKTPIECQGKDGILLYEYTINIDNHQAETIAEEILCKMGYNKSEAQNV